MTRRIVYNNNLTDSVIASCEKTNRVLLRRIVKMKMKQEIDVLAKCIQLASAGARGDVISDHTVCWNEVISTAYEQNVLSLVSCALLLSPELACPEQLKENLLNTMRNVSVKNSIRCQRVLHLVSEIEAVGIPVQILKGYSISRLYAYPESRDAVDSDLLVSSAHESEVYRLLEEKGFSVKARRLTANEGVCEHEKYGKIEVHVGLYPEITENVWKNLVDVGDFIKEKPIYINEQRGSFHTLGHTDQLLFLTLHMAKHFVESGLTIRMMLDIALHFAKHKSEINLDRYWSIIRKLNYDSLVNGIFWIMIEYGGFQVDSFPGISSKVSAHIALILRDLEEGGYMGAKELEERHDSGMEYNRQLLLKRKNGVRYWLYMLSWKLRSGANYMFPSYAMLKKIYPIVERYPLLVPVMWAYQTVSFPIKKLHSGVLHRDIRNNHSSMHAVSHRRMEMFRRLDML